MREMISICIPVYNGARWLDQCIASCVDQSYQPLEIIINDDCSSDDSVLIAENWQKNDPRIKVFRNDKNLGLVGNWNKTIQRASGAWIKLVFQDDYLNPQAISRFAEEIKDDVHLIVSKRNFILPQGASVAEKRYYSEEVRTLENTGYYETDYFTAGQISAIAAENICLNFIGEPSLTMFRKHTAEACGMFDDAFRQICDLEFLQRMATSYGLVYIPEKLCAFNIHEASTTSGNLSKNRYYLSNIEPVLIAYKMLYDDAYQSFRAKINFYQRYRVKTYFKVRTYEAFQNSLGNNEDKRTFAQVAEKYPEIGQAAKGSVLTKIKFFVLKQIRKTR